MFTKVATFRMLPPRRPAPAMSAPANDNRRNAQACASGRTRAPRLVCRWSLSENTGQPVCHWELDNADEPNPRWHDGSQRRRPIHKSVFQLSYQGEAAGAPFARHPTARGCERAARGGEDANLRRVLHARHSTMRSNASPDPAPSQCAWFGISLVANYLQLEAKSCAGQHRAS
jgi:hypothetical protein